MCMFCSDLPTDERAGKKKSYITLFLKPNDPENPKESYRFRLLNFRSPGKNDRTFAFISRFVHNHWGENENGIKIVDDYVVCPSSPYIDARGDQDLGFVDTFKELKLRDKKPTWDNVCPVCKHVAEAWNAWKSSGKTDRVAMDRIFAMQKQFQGIIPVYVINDPNNPKNNGRFKCIILNNQEEYKRLIELVHTEIAKISGAKKAGHPYDWCNGTNAVDFYLRMEKLPVTYKNGKQGFTRKITKMLFGQKPYDLVDASGKSIVTKEAIDRFEFDDQYYVKNNKSEIEEFYNKYFSLVSNNIPDEDIDSMTDDSVQAQVPTGFSIPQNKSASSDDTLSKKEIDELLSDPEDLPVGDVPSNDLPDEEDDTPSNVQDVGSVAELLSKFDFND